MESVYNSVCWMNYPQILHIPQKLLSIDFRLVYWELFYTLNHNRVKLHGIEQFPHLGSLTLPNHVNPETPNRQCDWPWMPISGDGKLHLTHFCNRSIIMQTAVYSIDCGLMYCVLIGLLCLHSTPHRSQEGWKYNFYSCMLIHPTESRGKHWVGAW